MGANRNFRDERFARRRSEPRRPERRRPAERPKLDTPNDKKPIDKTSYTYIKNRNQKSMTGHQRKQLKRAKELAKELGLDINTAIAYKKGRPMPSFSDYPVYITAKDHPTTKISPEQFQLLQSTLQSKLRGVLLGETAPQFKSCDFNDGIVTVSCVNEDTKAWLEGLIPGLEPVIGAELCVNKQERVHKMLITVTGAIKDLPPVEILALLKEQNVGLDTDKWILFHKRLNKKGMLTLFLKIDDASAGALAAKNYVAFLGLEQVVFKIYKKIKNQIHDPIDSDNELPTDLVEVPTPDASANSEVKDVPNSDVPANSEDATTK